MVVVHPALAITTAVLLVGSSVERMPLFPVLVKCLQVNRALIVLPGDGPAESLLDCVPCVGSRKGAEEDNPKDELFRLLAALLHYFTDDELRNVVQDAVSMTWDNRGSQS